MSQILNIAFSVLGIYVLLSSSLWITGALTFFYRRELKASDSFYDVEDSLLPSASVIIPAYQESHLLGACLDALAELDYPQLELIAVDDGSSDGTEQVVRSRLDGDPRLRLLLKRENEGKAMALNDAIAISHGEMVVVVDADARLHSQALRFMAAHFVNSPRVGAVTGNPRPINLTNLLAEMQVIEYASSVSLMRRAQVVWGRIMTMSGVVSAFRRSALRDVGLFDPAMSTEDIELTWRLQLALYDVRYEPRAVIGMTVPDSVAGLVIQRSRWARGLAQVMARFAPSRSHPLGRRQWPLFIDALFSIAWWHLLVGLAGVVVLVLIVPSLLSSGLGGFPWGFAAVVMLASLCQSAVGILLDRRYDRSAFSALLVAPWYPIFYWLLSGFPSVLVTLPTWFKSPPSSNTLWRSRRGGKHMFWHSRRGSK